MVSLWWVFAIACLVAGWCLVSTRTGRFVRHSIFDRSFRSLRELHAADVLRKLQVATAAGRPITGALSTLARYHFARMCGTSCFTFATKWSKGRVWQSMSAVDLVTPAEKRLLHTADRVGNRSWILGQIAAVKQGRTTTMGGGGGIGPARVGAGVGRRRVVKGADDLCPAGEID